MHITSSDPAAAIAIMPQPVDKLAPPSTFRHVFPPSVSCKRRAPALSSHKWPGHRHRRYRRLPGSTRILARCSRSFSPTLVQFSPPSLERVNSIADGDTVADPTLARAHPYDFRIVRIDCDGADRLRRGLIEDRLERTPAVHRLPDAAARRSGENGQAAALLTAETEVIRPLIIADPMLRAGSPDTVPESKRT